MPLGNVYYYFKTKDELAGAVIRERRDELQALFSHCEQGQNPKQRLNRFLDAVVARGGDTVRYGCPVGGLCQELNKDDGKLAEQAAVLLAQTLAWVIAQFNALGCKEAVSLAQHVVATLHGASLLANTMGKTSIIEDEVRRLRELIAAL